MKNFTSNAEWPEEACYSNQYGEPITTDDHDTPEQAAAVCGLLNKEGFGGQGTVFPIKTWVGFKDE